MSIRSRERLSLAGEPLNGAFPARASVGEETRVWRLAEDFVAARLGKTDNHAQQTR
jgi:hypothetical protein